MYVYGILYMYVYSWLKMWEGPFISIRGKLEINRLFLHQIYINWLFFQQKYRYVDCFYSKIID